MTSVDRWILPDGVDEMLPEQAKVAEQLRRSMLDTFARWGYQQIVPPLIEFTDSLLIGLGQDVDLQSFRLTDQLSGKAMAVRADVTPQAARIDAHSMQVQGVNRLCYAENVLHARSEALLASRCPIKVGAELYGDADASADIEMISLMLASIESAGVSQITLDLGHVCIYRAVLAQMRASSPDLDGEQDAALFDAIQRKSAPDLKVIASSIAADSDSMQRMLSLADFCGGRAVLAAARQSLGVIDGVEALIDEIEKVADAITARFPAVSIYFDLAELRGYNYHTGLVFAAYANGHGRALANGGRYDEIGEVFGAARPATGFSADLKSLVALREGSVVNKCDAIVAPHDDCELLWKKVCELREAGETVVHGGSGQRRLVKSGSSWIVEPAS